MNRHRISLFWENWRSGVALFSFYAWFLAVQWTLYKALGRVPEARGFDAIRTTVITVNVIVAWLLSLEWRQLRAKRLKRYWGEQGGRGDQEDQQQEEPQPGRLLIEHSPEAHGPKFRPLFRDVN